MKNKEKNIEEALKTCLKYNSCFIPKDIKLREIKRVVNYFFLCIAPIKSKDNSKLYYRCYEIDTINALLEPDLKIDNTIIFNRDEYKTVKKDTEGFHKLRSVSHIKVVNYLFGGDLCSGDIIESDNIETDNRDGIILLSDPFNMKGFLLNKTGKFSKKEMSFYGLVDYHKLIKKIIK